MISSSNVIADEMDPIQGNEREFLERLQREVLDTSAPREERLVLIKRLIEAYKPEFQVGISVSNSKISLEPHADCRKSPK